MKWELTVMKTQTIVVTAAPELAMYVVMNMVVRTITMVTVAFVTQK
jgi:hypothetical protein